MSLQQLQDVVYMANAARGHGLELQEGSSLLCLTQPVECADVAEGAGCQHGCQICYTLHRSQLIVHSPDHHLHPPFVPSLYLPNAGKGPAPTAVRLPDGSCVVRRVIPSDNSCLFTAVGYVMEHDRGKAAELRKVIADAVAADPGGWARVSKAASPMHIVQMLRDSRGHV